MPNAAGVAKIEQLVRQIAEPEGIEIVEVELKGGGKNQFLRITIDRPEGVTHADCELVSRMLGDLLDADDTIPAHYTLEVSSPGVERKLFKIEDFDRFNGKRAKLVLREPLNGVKTLDGILGGIERYPDGDIIVVTLNDDAVIRIPYSQIDRANLKFEW